LFADDTLLLLKAYEDQALRIKEVLEIFEKCTGQLVNPTKCSMLFVSKCLDRNKAKVLEIL
jgi:hypothetical protein